MSVMVQYSGHDDGIVLTDEQKRRQRGRSIALAFALGALAAVFFVLTIVKVGQHPLGKHGSPAARSGGVPAITRAALFSARPAP